MSVYHCPVCPLIFQFRTEVEWHLREEHRSRSDEAAALRSELAAASEPLSWGDLERLRSSLTNPSVTLLLATAPAATMTVLDVARLRQLAERARRRLAAEPDRDTPVGVVEDRLSKAVAAAESLPTERGLAVLVNRDHIRIVALPFGPRDRHVVGPSFATRDLEYGLRRYPRYRVLALGHAPRLFEGPAHQLIDHGTGHRGAEGPGPRAVPPAARAGHPDADRLIDDAIAFRGPLPLVVVGDHRDLERFRSRSRHADRVTLEVPRPRFFRGHVTDLVTHAVERIHHDDQERAVAELLNADGQSRIAWGVSEAWLAVRDGTAGRLWVEHDFAVAGRTGPGGRGPDVIADPAEPGAVDDLVDDLLARAWRLGAEVNLLDRNTLGYPEPVAVAIPLPAPVVAEAGRSLASA